MSNMTSDFTDFGIIGEDGALILGYFLGTPNIIPLPMTPICKSFGIRLSDLPPYCCVGNTPIVVGREELYNYKDRKGNACFITDTHYRGAFPVRGFCVDDSGIQHFRSWTKTGHSLSHKIPSHTDLCVDKH